jgi:hypothetical protein
MTMGGFPLQASPLENIMRRECITVRLWFCGFLQKRPIFGPNTKSVLNALYAYPEDVVDIIQFTLRQIP